MTFLKISDPEIVGKPVFTIVSLTAPAIMVGVNTVDERTQWMDQLNDPVTDTANSPIRRSRSFVNFNTTNGNFT